MAAERRSSAAGGPTNAAQARCRREPGIPHTPDRFANPADLVCRLHVLQLVDICRQALGQRDVQGYGQAAREPASKEAGEEAVRRNVTMHCTAAALVVTFAAPHQQVRRGSSGPHLAAKCSSAAPRRRSLAAVRGWRQRCRSSAGEPASAAGRPAAVLWADLESTAPGQVRSTPRAWCTNASYLMQAPCRRSTCP